MEISKRNYQPSPKDPSLLATFRENYAQTVRQLHRQLKRGKTEEVIKRRVRANRKLGYLNRMCQPQDSTAAANPGKYMVFPTPLGWSFLHARGLMGPPRFFNLETFPPRTTPIAVDIRTNKNAKHDLKLTDMSLSIREAFARHGWELLVWERLPAYIHDATEVGPVRPDALLIFRAPDGTEGACFVEVENTDQSVHDGLPSILKKCNRYQSYYESGAFAKRWGFKTFRVLFVMRTQVMAENQCERMRLRGDHYDSPRWYFTTDAQLPNFTEKVFISPRDFDKASHSLID